MPLKIRHRKRSEVPTAPRQTRVNKDIEQLVGEMSKLADGSVLQIELANEKLVRRTKGLITRAAKQLGQSWKHWHEGTNVYADRLTSPSGGTRAKRTR